MNFQEFRQAVKEYADGEYYSVHVEVSQNNEARGGEIQIDWGAYTNSLGWHFAPSPEEALLKLKGDFENERGLATEADVAAIGEVP